ncbi:hypothetical protein HED05_21700, partial [Escherichia coli]
KTLSISWSHYLQPKSIARIENCSVKTVYTHRRNAEAKLYSKIYKLVQ